MSFIVKQFVKNLFSDRKYFEGDESVDDADKAAADAAKAVDAARATADAAAAAKAAADAAKKTFNQEQVDRIVADRLARQKAQHEKVLGQLQDLEKNQNLTTEERDTLKTQIEEMRTSMMTKEELAAQERKRLETTHQSAVEKLTAEAGSWKTRYTTATIQRSILDAATLSEAIVPALLVDVLSPKTRLVEVKDADGKPTGELVPYAKFNSLDKDGKPIVLDLPVAEAVKQMKETPMMYGSLFKSGVTGGVGGTNVHQGIVNKGGVPSSYEDFIANRKHYMAAQQG